MSLDWNDDDGPEDKERAKLQRLLDDLNKWEPKPGMRSSASADAARAYADELAYRQSLRRRGFPLSCEPCRGTGTIRWVNETRTFTWPWAAACPWCHGERTVREIVERRGVA